MFEKFFVILHICNARVFFLYETWVLHIHLRIYLKWQETEFIFFLLVNEMVVFTFEVINKKLTYMRKIHIPYVN